MKIFNLKGDSNIYTSNVYLFLGDWNAIDDVNGLIDVGRDPSILTKIKQVPTGVGKKKLEKVILTHGHFDHVGLLLEIKREFNPKVYALHAFDGVDRRLKDGQVLKLANDWCEVIRTPGHTDDSICLYCEKQGILFSGDTPLIINSRDGSYGKDFVYALEKIARRNIKAIYPGHGQPLTKDVKRLLYMSLDNVRKGKVATIVSKSLH